MKTTSKIEDDLKNKDTSKMKKISKMLSFSKLLEVIPQKLISYKPIENFRERFPFGNKKSFF